MKPWHHYLRLALFVVVVATSWLPRPVQRLLARITARFIYVLAPRARRRLEKNQARALGGDVAPAKLREAVLAVLTNYGYYLLDFLALRRRRRAQLMRTRRGFDHLKDAADQGRGAILVTAHLGSWEMAALFLADEARSLTLVSQAEEIGYLGTMRSRIRAGQRHGEMLVGRDPMAAIELLDRLRRGELVGMQLDRVPGESFTSVPFCGLRLKMPRGPARLARASGAPIVPVFALFTEDDRYDLEIEAPIDPRGLSEGEIMERLAAVLERRVRAHPHQWLMMQDPWDDAPEPEPDGRARPRPRPASPAVA